MKTWKQLIEGISNSDEYIRANIKLQEELIKEYDKEIRKPLEDEIKRLKKQLDLNDKEHFKNALKQLRNADYESVKKPLIDTIVKLNEFISRLISEKEPETAREITERHYREIMLERQNKFLEDEIERLKKENKQLIKDNRLLDKTKYTAQQDNIDFFVEQKLNEMKGEK